MYNEVDFLLLNKSLKNYYRSIFWIRLLIVFTEFFLGLFGLKKTEKLLSMFSGSAKGHQPAAEAVLLDRYTTMFNEIKRRPYLKGRCLSQSIVMRFLLARQGIGSELVIGARLKNGLFDAHAWLQKQGVLINEHPSIVSEYPMFAASSSGLALKFK